MTTTAQRQSRPMGLDPSAQKATPAATSGATGHGKKVGNRTVHARVDVAAEASANGKPAFAAEADRTGKPVEPPAAPKSDSKRSGSDRLVSAAMALLKVESDVRQARTANELAYYIANEPRAVTRAQQIVMFERGTTGAMNVRAVSSISRVDRSAPLVLWFEATVVALGANHGLSKPREFDTSAFATPLDSVRNAYPMRNLLWVPMLNFKGEVIGGLLQARSIPWTEHDIAISSHLTSGFAIAWMAMTAATSRFRIPGRITRRGAALAGLAIAALALLPVSMSALAPVEVAPRDPFIVTTGVEGVVDKVLVEPNAIVVKGQPLVQLADTVLKNRFEIAEREVLVAQTKYKKASQLAFVDVRGRHEMALAQAELELKTAERDYARELFDRATVKADRDGVAFFSDKKDLLGRPVAVGEKLMEIALPTSTEFHVDLGVADAIVLHEGARIKVFLDSAPLQPIEATLIRADYQARPRDNQQMAFRIVAQANSASSAPLQLGVRGTAQVYSDTVVLGFYLLRRPIAAARQWIGL